MSIANDTIKNLEQQYNPIPGWREVANSYDSISGDFKIPFIGFSFQNSASWTNGNGTKYLVPDQVIIDTGFVPGATPQQPHAFRLADEVSNFQISELLNGSGHFGWLGGLNDPSKLYSAYYQQGVSLAVYQTFYPLYSLNMSDSITQLRKKRKQSHLNSTYSTTNYTLSRYASAALESLPPVYDSSTKSVFDLFIKTFGTSFATVSLRGGGIEDVIGWPSCLWKGPSPQSSNLGAGTGTGNCVFDSTNFDSMIAARNFTGRSTVVNSIKYGGDPTIEDPLAWSKTISLAPVVLSYATHVHLSELLPDEMSATRTSLEQAISDYEQSAIQTVQNKAQAARASQKSQPRPVVFELDVGGICKSGDLAPGQSWNVQCGPSIAPFTSAVDMKPVSDDSDDSVTLVIEGGAPEVSCGCSELKIDVRRELHKYDRRNHSQARSNFRSTLSPSPAPFFDENLNSNKPSPIVPKDMKCHFEKKVSYLGNTFLSIPDVSDPGRCCDLCSAHHSCQFWTYHLSGKDGAKSQTCELKLAKSDTQCCDNSHGVDECPHDCRHVVVSGSRNGDAPPQDYAHFCFNCQMPSVDSLGIPSISNDIAAKGFPIDIR